MGIQHRLLLLAGVLILEATLASLAFDTNHLRGKGDYAPLLRGTGPLAVRWSLAFVSALSLFAATRWRFISSSFPSPGPFRFPLLILHGASASAFAWLGYLLFFGRPEGRSADLLTVGFLVSSAVMGFSLVLAFMGIRPWIALLNALKDSLALAAFVATLVMGGALLAQRMWGSTVEATFRLVHLWLALFQVRIVAEPERAILGSDRFQVHIDASCSGYEGLALMLVFSTGWLWWFRKEYRFPAALALIPASLAAIYTLNALRIAVLILIGHAGHPGVAMGGFHSQAGWISFNLVAFALCLLSSRIRLLQAGGTVREEAGPEGLSVVAAYLVPFLTVLAMGMMTKALSASFETLYPLRVLAAAAALWYFRDFLARLEWRWSWWPVLGGAAVFALWVAPSLGSAAEGAPAAFAAMHPALPWAWLAFRVLGAAVTVPMVEELAFRGFGYRRLIQEQFEDVPFGTMSWTALALSSLAFGALHGGRWVEGAIAGAVYGGLMVRSGRLTDAVVAHSVTNLLLAAYVLQSGRWQLW